MAKIKEPMEIPFDKDGNQLKFPDYNATKFMYNYEFDTTLEFVEFERGRSAAGARFKCRKANTTVYVFLTDLSDFIKCGLSDGVIVGKFTFQKRGQNYGARLVKEK